MPQADLRKGQHTTGNQSPGRTPQHTQAIVTDKTTLAKASQPAASTAGASKQQGTLLVPAARDQVSERKPTEQPSAPLQPLDISTPTSPCQHPTYLPHTVHVPECKEIASAELLGHACIMHAGCADSCMLAITGCCCCCWTATLAPGGLWTVTQGCAVPMPEGSFASMACPLPGAALHDVPGQAVSNIRVEFGPEPARHRKLPTPAAEGAGHAGKHTASADAIHG
jgi:hypothetical protein